MGPETIDIAMLRQLAIGQPEALSTRIIGILLGSSFLLAVLLLVHRGKLREEYTPIWVATAAGILIGMVFFDLVRWLTWAVGAWTPSSTLFFLGMLFLLVVSLNYAVRLSGLRREMSVIAQELALLRCDLAREDPASRESATPRQ